MLDKLVIHLKNVIFFKAVIYITALIALFLLIPVIKENLATASNRYNKAYSFLQDADLKLDSIINFEDEILKDRENYDRLSNQHKNLGCINRTRIMHNIKQLANKYNLFEPISTDIARIFNTGQTANTSGHIKLHHYELNVHFKSKDYTDLFIITENIYNILPKGSIVVSAKMNSIDALTPKIVNILNKSNAPAPITVRMKIHLREIVYE